MNPIFNAINACILGYVITLIALFLNLGEEDKLGICCAVAALACAYFFEQLYARGTKYPQMAGFLDVGAVAFTVLSYVFWLT